MKITTTTSHAVKFSVQAFWDEEGGMGNETYGSEVDELPEAIRLLELARVSDRRHDWIITLEVTTTTKQSSSNPK